MTVYHGINVYDNTADVGLFISACSSQISLSLPTVALQQPDPNFLTCTTYNDDIRFNTSTFQSHSYQNITILVNDLLRDNNIFSDPVVNVGSGNELQSINSKLHQTTIVVYISLALSVVLIIIFLLLGVTVLVVYCKFKRAKSPHRTYNQPELFTGCGNYNADAKDIEMKSNVIYDIINP